jgi:hypothetical protein
MQEEEGRGDVGWERQGRFRTDAPRPWWAAGP